MPIDYPAVLDLREEGPRRLITQRTEGIHDR